MEACGLKVISQVPIACIFNLTRPRQVLGPYGRVYEPTGHLGDRAGGLKIGTQDQSRAAMQDLSIGVEGLGFGVEGLGFRV